MAAHHGAVASTLVEEQHRAELAPPPGGLGIELRGVAKAYPLGRGRSLTALEGVDLSVAPGGFTALLGPSGCGKSTILRMVAGLDQPDAGTLAVGGRSPGELARAHRLGVAFQDHALLPWLSVADNVALPFRLARRPVDRDRVDELVRLVGLGGFERARPRQLSGGMRQRASIARALALDPDVLLLDEPFGALDAVTRRRLNVELRHIWEQRRTTTLMVTHDVTEAVFLADQVVVLAGRPGRVAAARPVGFSERGAGLLSAPAFHAVADDLSRLLDCTAGDEPVRL